MPNVQSINKQCSILVQQDVTDMYECDTLFGIVNISVKSQFQSWKYLLIVLHPPCVRLEEVLNTE